MNKKGNFKDTDGNNLLGFNFASNIITKDGQSVDDALDKKVDKEAGKVLSTNDYTEEEAEVDDPNIEPFTREQSDFEYKFIPAVLEVDMEIVAVSMGKLVAEYKVTEVGEDNATAESPSGVELLVLKNLNSNGSVVKVSGGVEYTADYYVMMEDMKKRVSNQAIINAMTASLSEGATRIAKISASSDTYDLQSAQASIDQTLQVIYNKFGV